MTALIALLAGTVTFAAAAVALSVPRRVWVRRRLAPHVGGLAEEARPLVPRRDAEDLWRATDRVVRRLRLADRLAGELGRAGFDLQVAQLAWICVAAAFVAFVFGLIAGSLALAVVLVPAGLAAPLLVLRVQAVRRARAFDEQLPELLDGLAASLKAGHGFDQALRSIAAEAAEPGRRELQRVLSEMRLGRSPDEALAGLRDRVVSQDLSFVLSAIGVQRQVGGSLAELFAVVAETVRSRHQFRRKLRAITGMVRASATILSALPFAAGLLLTLVNRSYMAPLWHRSSGHVLLAVAVGMMALGSVVLRRIGSVKA